MATDLWYTSATELAALVRDRQLSPVEVVEDCIARIEERNPSLNAVIYLGFDDARAAAVEAERAVLAGEPLGPLHGVPTLLKDLFDFKPGWVTTFGGIRALADWRASFSCIYAERMERAGAIVLGKTNTPVMGFRGIADNPLFGATANPFDVERNPGGSSGGSAAAVADGLVPVAEGTDGGGSIRIPSAWCGVYGFQPSFGRVPFVGRPNVFAGMDPFLYEGPITRTVADAALSMSALAGYDVRDPFSIEQEVDLLSGLDRPLDGWTVAFSPNLDVFPVEPEVATVVADAVRAFESAGARVEEVELGLGIDQAELCDVWYRSIIPANLQTLMGMRADGIDLLGEHADDLPEAYRAWIEKGFALTALDMAEDRSVRTHVYDTVQKALGEHRILVTPTVAATAVRNRDDGNTLGPSTVAGVQVDPAIGWCLTYITNLTGNPAASLPAGLTPQGLPVGLQVIGRRYADADVLRASAAFERERPWVDSYRICRDRSIEGRVGFGATPSSATARVDGIIR